MLRTLNDQPTLWELILPAECLGLPPALAEVDRLLDDPRFFESFRPFFTVGTGRPSIPMETYLRMMFLRFRYDLGFERLCAEVIDSLAWRRFVGSRSGTGSRTRPRWRRSPRGAGRPRSTG